MKENKYGELNGLDNLNAASETDCTGLFSRAPVTDAEEVTEEPAQTFDGDSDFEFAFTISSGTARIDSVTTSLTTQYDHVIAAKFVSDGIEYSVSSIKDSAYTMTVASME